jgi:arsenate reductase (thioredoxin)
VFLDHIGAVVVSVSILGAAWRIGRPARRELSEIDFDVVITVCGHANEHCPLFPGATRVIHVGFDDPPTLAADARTADEALAHYRRVRDEIRAYVETLPDEVK